jgi:hypothetical protein
MKKISIEEADKILAAHRPKDTNCPYCGVNIKDSHIPKQRIKDRIAFLEKQLMKPLKYPDYKYARIDELRKLLE